MFNWKKNKGKAMIYIEDCIGCGACADACCYEAIGFIYIQNERYAKLLQPDQCTGCGRCARVCSTDTIVMQELIPVPCHA